MPKPAKPSKSVDEARSEARVSARQRRLAAKSAAQGGGSVLSNKKKTTTSKPTAEGASAKRMPKKTPPPAGPKKNNKTTKPTPKPKLYTTISVQTGKPVDKKVTAAQHLANLDARKAFLKRRKAAASKISSALKKGKN